MRRRSCDDVPLGDYFEKASRRQSKNPKAVANWVINNLRAKTGAKRGRSLTRIAEDSHARTDIQPNCIALVGWRQRSAAASPRMYSPRCSTPANRPRAIVEKKGLAQVSDTGAIEKFCDEVIAANPESAADFKAGKAAALNFLKGQVMKASKGKANPAVVGEILERKLKP